MFTKKESSHSGLKIIIVGCGKVGRNLAEQLSNEGHDITIVDKKAAMIQQMCNMYDVLGIEGNGASYTIQREAGIANADLLIAEARDNGRKCLAAGIFLSLIDW